MANKVIWNEGLFIRPQHFQQQEKYLLSELHQRVAAVQKFNAGVSAVSINESDLQQGRVTLNSVVAVFQDGTCFDAPGVQAIPTPLPVPEGARDVFVHLVLAVSNTQTAEVSSQRANTSDGLSASRYYLVKEKLKDGSHKDGSSDVVDLAELDVRLMMESASGDREGNTIPNGALTIPVAHVREVVGGVVMLNEAFIPMTTNIGASKVLLDFLNELLSVTETRADALAAVVSGKTAGSGVGSLGDFVLLQTLNRVAPLLYQFLELKNTHPLSLYEFLVSFAGELSTHMTQRRRPPRFPVYQHEWLNQCFDALMDEINRAFKVTIEQRVQQIQISQPNGHGIRAARLTNKQALNTGALYIAVKANTPENEIVSQFPRLAKLSAGETIGALIDGNLPGIPLQHLPQPPQEIPYHSGYLYFALNKQGEHWNGLLKSAGLTIFVSNEANTFPGLSMQLWLVNK